MGFSENESTPVSNLSHLAEVGFDPDGDPTPIQMPGRRLLGFRDPFDGDMVVRSIQVAEAREERTASTAPAGLDPDQLFDHL